jgi:hypothetical protein
MTYKGITVQFVKENLTFARNAALGLKVNSVS